MARKLDVACVDDNFRTPRSEGLFHLIELVNHPGNGSNETRRRNVLKAAREHILC